MRLSLVFLLGFLVVKNGLNNWFMIVFGMLLFLFLMIRFMVCFEVLLWIWIVLFGGLVL